MAKQKTENPLSDNAFQTAMEYHQKGDFAQADALYRQILQQQPNNPDALHCLGLLAYQLGQNQAAVDLISKAIAVYPTSAGMYCNLGLALQAQGKLEQAVSSYLNAISLQPDYADAHSNLANALLAQGKLDDAIENYRKVIFLNPNSAIAYNGLGLALQTQGNLDEAVKNYLNALSLQPDYTEALSNLGNAYVMQKNTESAITSYRRVLSLNPNNAAVHNNLGSLLKEQGKLDAASEQYQQALLVNPAYTEAYYNLAITLKELGRLDAAIENFQQALSLKQDYIAAYLSLGITFHELGKLEAAIESYQQVLRITPDSVEAHYGLGSLFYCQNRLDQATESYKKVVEIKPDYIDAHNSLGVIFEAQAKPDLALKSYQNALLIDPNYAETHYNLGILFQHQGKLNQSVESYKKAVSIQPDYIEARANLALQLLSLGQFEEGWQHNEARHSLGKKNRQTLAPDFQFPQWQGEDINGKSLLIWCEQGLGDEIQFCRYVSVLKSHGARHITWVCKKPLTELFKTLADVDSVFTPEEMALISAHDYWAFPLSLPLHCKTRLETIPATVPYLYANQKQQQAIALSLKSITEFKIGICWKGNPNFPDDATRSPGIAWFNSLFKLPRVKFFTIQPDTREEFIRAAGKSALDRGHEIDKSSFEEAAALIMNLDLVITSCTSICHLAGALGKPVWVVLPFKADWRWLTDREDSPWYPTVRLFRQTEPGNWGEVFQRVENRLKKVIAGESSVIWPAS